ncbi:MAG TPA: STM4014 family protein [Armatimonadota bacterium]|nr:STM4014 family protein [Armatimonadota bacterium]
MLIGNPECRRVLLFREALTRAGLPPARLVPWLELLRRRVQLAQVVRRGDGVRIESPGRNWEVERALLERGADVSDEAPFARISPAMARELCPDRGRIVCSRQWYLGFRSVLEQIERELSECPRHTRMQEPGEIARMFDKPECQAGLRAAGVPVPRTLGVPESYEELLARMEQTDCRRVFVKLAHGSSASGVVAYQTDGVRHQAMTTVETVRSGGELLLYNTRRLRLYRDPCGIAELVDALCRHRVHAEQWLPKAGISGHTFDLRVLVIGGRVRHMVPRLSRTPMTNLHLLNRRGDLEAVRERLRVEAWEAMRETCRRAAAHFPRSLHAGLDVLISPDFRRHAVLEVNAFGDLLPGITCDGRDTYADELAAVGATRTGSVLGGEPCSALAS